MESSALLNAELEEIRTQHQAALQAEYHRLEGIHNQQCAALKNEHESALSARLAEERSILLPELKRAAQESREGWTRRWMEEFTAQQESLEQAAAQALSRLRMELQSQHAQQIERESIALRDELAMRLSDFEARLSADHEAALSGLRATARINLEQALNEQRQAAESLDAERRAVLEAEAQKDLEHRWASVEAELLEKHQTALAAQAAQLAQQAEMQYEVHSQQMKAVVSTQLAESTLGLEGALEREKQVAGQRPPLPLKSSDEST